MRALEAELERTFPAIKKQIDSLHKSEALDINKNGNKRAIAIKKDFQKIIKNLLMYALKKDLKTIFNKYPEGIESYYPGKAFGYEVEPDIIIIHNNSSKEELDKIKENISHLFSRYFINMVYITCMSVTERDQRYRLADRFILNIMRQTKAQKQ